MLFAQGKGARELMKASFVPFGGIRTGNIDGRRQKECQKNFFDFIILRSIFCYLPFLPPFCMTSEPDGVSNRFKENAYDAFLSISLGTKCIGIIFFT
jgi:hypothetical protein